LKISSLVSSTHSLPLRVLNTAAGTGCPSLLSNIAQILGWFYELLQLSI
jgi:hypothetical protein